MPKKPSYEELEKQLEEMKNGNSGDLSFKISEKGCLSVYGLGRFPVSLYYEQWKRLLSSSDRIKQFLKENKSKMKLKKEK